MTDLTHPRPTQVLPNSKYLGLRNWSKAMSEMKIFPILYGQHVWMAVCLSVLTDWDQILTQYVFLNYLEVLFFFFWNFHFLTFFGQFSEISRSFFQNSDIGLKFWHNTLLKEYMKTYFHFFRNFNFFKVKKSIFGNFKVIFQNSDRGLKFWHNTLLTEYIKTYFHFFQNFNFFKVKKSIFGNFKVKNFWIA